MTALEFTPIPLPASADPVKLGSFGREVRNIDPTNINQEDFTVLEQALYKHGFLLFRDVNITPDQQHRLVKAFDPEAKDYGHGNKKSDMSKKSSLFSQLRNIPDVPQVQVIGHGTIHNHQGIPTAKLQHPSHRTLHRTPLSDVEEEKGFTRFYHWHMDAALYNYKTPRVTALYAVNVPQGSPQTVRYDDGTGDELEVPLGTTAFICGNVAFEILPPELKSLAVRSRVRYAPHPFVWMASARTNSTGLMLETEDLEVPCDKLPRWDESKVQVLPVLWKNPVTGGLHLEIATTAIELLVEPLPENARYENTYHPHGAHITDLAEIRALLHKLQRPGIAPSLVYPHPWNEKDLIVFHNRGVLHTLVGVFKDDHIRVFHQSNLAAVDDPKGPDKDDVKRWA